MEDWLFFLKTRDWEDEWKEWHALGKEEKKRGELWRFARGGFCKDGKEKRKGNEMDMERVSSCSVCICVCISYHEAKG